MAGSLRERPMRSNHIISSSVSSCNGSFFCLVTFITFIPDEPFYPKTPMAFLTPNDPLVIVEIPENVKLLLFFDLGETTIPVPVIKF